MSPSTLAKQTGKGRKMEGNDRKWRELSLFEDRINISIPEEFSRPPEEIVEQKFPYDSRPREIYGNENGSRIMTFELSDQELSEGEVRAAAFAVQKLVGHMYPESVEKQAAEVQTPAGKAGWFYYVTGGINGEQGHILFVLPLDGRMLLGGFHFSAEMERIEEKLFLEMLERMERSGEDKS